MYACSFSGIPALKWNSLAPSGTCHIAICMAGLENGEQFCFGQGFLLYSILWEIGRAGAALGFNVYSGSIYLCYIGSSWSKTYSKALSHPFSMLRGQSAIFKGRFGFTQPSLRIIFSSPIHAFGACAKFQIAKPAQS